MLEEKVNRPDYGIMMRKKTRNRPFSPVLLSSLSKAAEAVW